jgi:hypothetical protein
MGFQVSSKAKKVFYGLIAVGLVLLVLGFFTQKRFLYATYIDENNVMVEYNYDKPSEADVNKLIGEIESALGEGYQVIVHNETGHDHGHAESHGDDHAEEGKEDLKGDAHAAHGPSLVLHIQIGKPGEEMTHSHGDAGHENHDHDANHAEEVVVENVATSDSASIVEDTTHNTEVIAEETIVEDHNHDDHAGHDHAAGHGEGHEHEHHYGHGIDPAQAIVDKFESAELAFADGEFRRFWSNLLINGFFFMGIALGALFYLALHYATESGWGVVLLRIFEGVSSALPLGIIVLLIVFIAASLGLNHIYPWMDSHHAETDRLIYEKGAYLNKIFFWIRIVAYFAVFLFFMNWFRKTSRREDEEGGVALHYLMYRRAALFLVFFAVFSSTMSWDIIMSIDVHWFSTLFGWYTFSGIWLSAMIMIMMITLYLKNRGELPEVNDSHIHDVGKWMFALSFLWSYLWFSQFMLIWYSNIPEEVIYYVYRFDSYSTLFLGMFAVNFILPMVFFMSRDTKRSWPYLIVIGMIIFIGHWFDVFCMVMPGTLFEEWQFGMLEIGMFMMFLGGFLLLVFKGLSKGSLVQKNHPFLQESIHHDY